MIRTVTRDPMGLCEVVTYPDGVIVRDYREKPAQGLTAADIVAILRANPKAALEASRECKIAGPRMVDGFGPSFRVGVTGEIVGDLGVRTMTQEEERAEDDALRGAGWVLVDG